MLTKDGGILTCTWEQVKLVAECANLRCYDVPFWYVGELDKHAQSLGTSRHFMWQDRQTGGGACRLVFVPVKRHARPKYERKPGFLQPQDVGTVWISNHSGYAYADITADVQELFLEMGCTRAAMMGWIDNPHMYSQRS